MGYRVISKMEKIILLLSYEDKRTKKQDVEKARQYWKNYRKQKE